VVATEQGGSAPAADPLLLTGVVFGRLGAEAEPAEFYRQLTQAPEYVAPIGWDTIEPAGYDGLFLPGGHAPGMRQYLGSPLLQAKVAAFWALDRPVAAICHGVLVLARAKDPATGRSVIAEKRTTCLPKYMERTAFLTTAWRRGRYYRTYPAYVQDEVTAALDQPSQFVRGPRTLTTRGTATDDRAAFLVEDGRYLSARWPGDAYLIAHRFEQLLRGGAAGRQE
jgi:putative intracellular protease/amidase